jgi:acyl-CoA synthetase (AMP-forming)/AMP-acid ligase II
MNNLLSAQSIGSFLKQTRDVAPESPPAPEPAAFEAIAHRWGELGLRPGDLVLLCLPNGIALLEQFFGALHAGLVPALVAPNTPSTRVRELARVLRARAVAAPRLNPAAVGTQRRETIGTLEAGLLGDQAPSLTRPGEVVILTSGTSGFASGCVFGIDQLLLNAERHADSIGQRPDDTVLVNLPLYYSFALVAQTLATFLRGGRLVLDGPPFHAARYARTISQFGITISSLTPILVRALLQGDAALAAGPRVLSIGGDSLAREDVARLLQRRPGKELYLTYGLTQAGPRVSTLAAHAEPAHRHASLGRPLAGTTVSLLPIDGDAGMKELQVSSATVMRRRIGLVEGRQSQNPFAPGTVATGDVFEEDADGYLYFRGRLSDFVVRKGEKICLAAVRRVANQLPHVVHARTHIIRSETGDQDYELTLHLSAPVNGFADLLRRKLRRSEMPCNIHVETSGPAIVTAHK